MLPAIGPVEILLVIIAAIAAVLLGGFGSWSLVIIACFVCAMLITPADPLSTLLLAIPALVAIRFLSLWRVRQDEDERE
jgi:Sec-independent protein secretion pathway component TatC